MAVGGFGRGELYPHSDIDLALISSKNLTTVQKNQLSSLLNILWDWGLSPSLTIGTVQELFTAAKNELTLETSFLESRYLLGNRQLYSNLQQQLDVRRDLVAFIKAKIDERQNRHDRYQGAAKQLEPDIKNSPGGLRDLHTIFWIMRAEGLQATPDKLPDIGILTADEIKLLRTGHQDLARIRIHLHQLTGKNENILFFNYHLDLAKAMGFYRHDPEEAVEKLMQLFYRSTKIITQLQTFLIPVLQRRIYMPYPRLVSKITKDYYQVNHMIAAYDLTVFHQNPCSLLTIIKYLQSQHGIMNIAPETLRAWWSAVQNLSMDLAHDPGCRKLFLDLFKYGRGIFEILQLLNLYGFLEKYLPEFGKITGLLQNDLFHIYPVDDHILMVIYYLTRLEDENFSYEAPIAYQLMRTYKKKYCLYLAALFHDIGKGRHGNHESVGAKLALDFCRSHNMNAKDTALITWLVKNHLILSLTAQKKDTGDEKVIRNFCELVTDGEKLISLYLLTSADIRGTNPTIWNNWKQNLIFTLFSVALSYLEKGENSLTGNLKAKQSLPLSLAVKFPAQVQIINDFTAAVDPTFFTNQNEDDLSWQLTALAAAAGMDFYDIKSLDKKTFKCIIYLPTTGNELYKLCKIFAHLYLNIIQARTYLTRNGQVLYKFIAAVPEKYNDRDLKHRLNELTAKLQQLLSGKLDTAKLTIPRSVITRRSRHANIMTRVKITQEPYNDNDQDYFLVALVTVNRNGLLAAVVALFDQYEARIIFANINTLGERVEDSFLVKAPLFTQNKIKNKFKNALTELGSL